MSVVAFDSGIGEKMGPVLNRRNLLRQTGADIWAKQIESNTNEKTNKKWKAVVLVRDMHNFIVVQGLRKLAVENPCLSAIDFPTS